MKCREESKSSLIFDGSPIPEFIAQLKVAFLRYKSIGDVADWLPVSTRLLSNVSRHFPGETFTILSSLDVNLLDTLLGEKIRKLKKFVLDRFVYNI